MNRFVFILVLFCSSLVAGCVRNVESVVPTTIKNKNQTVAIVEKLDDETRVICSGVWVNDDTFVTARHCVEGAAIMQKMSKMTIIERLEMMFSGKRPSFEDKDLYGLMMHYSVENEMQGLGSDPKTIHPALAVAVDEVHDIAVVRVESDHPYHLSAPIVVNVPEDGTDVHIVGHTKGLYWTYMKGTVGSVRKEIPGLDIEGPFVQIVAPISNGNSGGGAFDSHGCLVGIASFMLNVPSEGFFIHPTSVKKILDDNHISYKLAR